MRPTSRSRPDLSFRPTIDCTSQNWPAAAAAVLYFIFASIHARNNRSDMSVVPVTFLSFTPPVIDCSRWDVLPFVTDTSAVAAVQTHGQAAFGVTLWILC